VQRLVPFPIAYFLFPKKGNWEQITGNRQLTMGNSAAFRSIPYLVFPITKEMEWGPDSYRVGNGQLGTDNW